MTQKDLLWIPEYIKFVVHWGKGNKIKFLYSVSDPFVFDTDSEIRIVNNGSGSDSGYDLKSRKYQPFFKIIFIPIKNRSNAQNVIYARFWFFFFYLRIIHDFVCFATRMCIRIRFMKRVQIRIRETEMKRIRIETLFLEMWRRNYSEMY